MHIYETTVKDIGSIAQDFANEGLVILFGGNIPPELKDICYHIELSDVKDVIKPGMFFYFDKLAYQIVAVGNEAQNNLSNLGHITLNFNGSTNSVLAGTIYLENKKMPLLKIGTKIYISESKEE